MSPTAILSGVDKLWKALLPHLKRLGRWLITRLKTKGLQRVIGFMDVRIDTFKRRLSRARRPRRKKWLKGRIKRWTRALAWLESNAQDLLDKLIDALSDKADKVKKLSWNAPGESYKRWAKAAA